MTEDMTQLTEREEVEMLVPFYVTGRISDEDARRVDAYLKRNPDFAEHIELVRDERAATVAVNEALGFPSARSADRVFEAIDAEPAPMQARARAASRGLMASVRDFFASPTPRAVRYAAVAAAAVVMIQAAAMMTMVSGPQSGAPQGYQTASGPGSTVKAAALLAFQDTATLADMTRVLKGARAKIIEGPVAGGFYTIAFTQEDLTDAAKAEKLSALAAQSGVVKRVLPK